MLNTNPTISLGDLVIVYEDYKTMKHVYVKSGSVYHNNFGSFKHDDMVGRPFGHKMASHNGHGFVHLLQPTAELWTASLSHRTQILYIADISMICLQLELLPGHRVIEAGTGSGSLSHGLARSVGPAGRLFTYEFNEARALAAAGEFADNKLAQVTCCHADVCAEGYVYPGIEPASIDAVIFDLPQPWDAVARVAPYVRPGGRLCCFSPCIEQIARTMEVLPGLGFTCVEVIETLVKTHDVRPVPTHDPIAAIVEQAARGEDDFAGPPQQQQPQRRASSESSRAQGGAGAGAGARRRATEGAERPRSQFEIAYAEEKARKAAAAAAAAASAATAATSDAPASAAVPADATACRGNDGNSGAAAAEAEAAAAEAEAAAAEAAAAEATAEAAAEPAASTAVAAAASTPEPPTKRQRSEAEAGSAAGSDGRATGGERAGSGGPPPRLQTKPYDDLRGHTGFLLFCTKHVGDGATEA